MTGDIYTIRLSDEDCFTITVIGVEGEQIIFLTAEGIKKYCGKYFTNLTNLYEFMGIVKKINKSEKSAKKEHNGRYNLCRA